MRIGKLKKAGISLLSLFMIVGLFTSNVKTIEAINQLNTVNTISTKNKIKMTMYKYDKGDENTQDLSILKGQYDIYPNQYANKQESGNVKQGLVQNRLNSEGIPLTAQYSEYISQNDSVSKVTQTSGTALDYYFKDNVYQDNLDNLFLESEYNNSGYYEYSSFENFAHLQKTEGNTGSFIVYNQIGTPLTNVNNVNKAYYRGNFFPLDNIQEDRISTLTRRYDEDGKQLEHGDPGYNQQLYHTTSYTCHFGMTLEATFSQPQNGQVTHNDMTESMIYTFNGDDDLWLFIDGVLVLDIGGIHDAHSGTINFETGEVTVHISDTKTVTTTIKQCFKNAGVFPDGTNYDENKENQYFSDNTFKDFTPHSMKMFYMERGGGCSNLHMKFNLQLIPDGQIQIGKQLSSDTNSFVYGNVDFGFKLYVEDDNGQYEQVTREDVDIYQIYKKKINSDTAETVKWDTSGEIFYLQPDEIAYFNNLKVDKKYKVEEVEIKSDEFDKVEIAGTAISIVGKEEVYNVQSGELSIAYNPVAMFINSVNIKNKQNLKIEKLMKDDQVSDDTFDIRVEFKDDDGNYIPYTGSYLVYNSSQTSGNGNANSTNNGIIQIKANQYAMIHDILSGNEFRVTEVNLNDYKYNVPSYITKCGESEQNSQEGTISLQNNAYVKVTNDLKKYKLHIVKKIDKVDFNDGDPIFTFKITSPNGKYIYKTLRFDNTLVPKDDGSYELSFDLDNLPYGVYTVEELNTLRYKCYINGELKSSTRVNLNSNIDVLFNNELTYDKNFSHTDVVENSFTIDENGTVNVHQKLNKEAD